MNETLVSLLNAISDTRGFLMFCLVIAVAYASIWALFLFEAPPKKKKAAPAKKKTSKKKLAAKPKLRTANKKKKAAS